MRIAGIIILIFGSLSVLGGILATLNGNGGSLAGIAFVAIGAYLIRCDKKKKEEEKEKREWEENNL